MLHQSQEYVVGEIITVLVDGRGKVRWPPGADVSVPWAAISVSAWARYAECYTAPEAYGIDLR